MTVSTTAVSVSYSGDGTTTAFPITFQFGASADLSVALIDADGNETAQSLTTHYTVSQSAGGTGTLTMLTAPASGYTLRIRRITAKTQPGSLRNMGSYYPETVEQMFDRNTRQIQEVQEATERSLRFPFGSNVDGELATPVAGGVPMVNDDEDGFSWALWGTNPEALASLSMGSGAALVGFKQSGTGAVARTMQDKGRETVTPFDFGAVGDLTTDDTDAVQKFFDHVAANHVPNAEFSGSFLLKDTIFISGFGQTDNQFVTKTVQMNADLLFDMDISEQKPGLKFEYVNHCSFPGTTIVRGKPRNWGENDSTLYDGVVFGRNCAGCSFGTFRVQYVHKWACYRGLPGEGAGADTSVAGIQANRCGSSNIGAEREGGTYTVVDHSTSGSGTSERSTITVDRPLPIGFDTTAYIIGDPDGGSNIYAVIEVISDTEFTVYPRMDADIAESATIRLAFGGAVYQEDNASGLWRFGNVNGLGVANVWVDRCSYGSNIDFLRVSAAVMSGALGAAPNTPVYGGHIGHVYIESGAFNSGLITHNISTTHLVSEARISDANDFYTPLANGGSAYVRGRYGGMIVCKDSIGQTGSAGFLEKSMSGSANSEPSTDRVWARPAAFPIGVKFGSSKTIALVTPDEASIRNGLTSVAFFSSRPDGTPPGGTWTVLSYGSESTVEGGASKQFLIAGVKLFLCVFDPANNDWKVHTFNSSNELTGSKTQNWGSLASGAEQTTTVTVAGAALGDFAEASMSVDLAGTKLFACVSAADTVTVIQRNDTGSAVDLASGTLRVRVRKPT